MSVPDGLANGVPRLVITSGEPAGIGPDLLLALGATGSPDADFDADFMASLPVELVIAGNRSVFESRAQLLGLRFHWPDYQAAAPAMAGDIRFWDVPIAQPAQAGHLDPRNAAHVLELLDRAADGCQIGRAHV